MAAAHLDAAQVIATRALSKECSHFPELTSRLLSSMAAAAVNGPAALALDANLPTLLGFAARGMKQARLPPCACCGARLGRQPGTRFIVTRPHF
jgi:hypothetical protein